MLLYADVVVVIELTDELSFAGCCRMAKNNTSRFTAVERIIMTRHILGRLIKVTLYNKFRFEIMDNTRVKWKVNL